MFDAYIIHMDGEVIDIKITEHDNSADDPLYGHCGSACFIGSAKSREEAYLMAFEYINTSWVVAPE